MPAVWSRFRVMTVHFDTISQVEHIDVRPAGTDAHRAGGLYRAAGKRIFDLFVIILSAPVWVPALAIITVLLIASGAHPFFLQKRIGKHGVEFRMLKFRTMVTEAETALRRHISEDPDAHAEWQRHQKLRHDPRITPLGGFLRKTSLDELPQLLNVLKGDMSLVGPRPMMPDQRELYPGSAYFCMRPGITGPWQVSERNACAFTDRADYDTRYLTTMSAWADLGLLFSTVSVVFRGTGY